MTDTQHWHSLYDLSDPERMPFSAQRLRRQGFSSHSALALKLENTSLKLPG